jgi:methionine--tRNA ligase beta chain
MITFDDVKKVEIKVGKILLAEKVEGSEKLLRLEVDFGEEKPRQVVSGISKGFADPQELVGGFHPFVTNLEPRMIMGLESQAMILALVSDSGLALLSPTKEVVAGANVS